MTLDLNLADNDRYDQAQEQGRKDWEVLCGCCGSCCGALDGDPCEHLIKVSDHKYSCQIYESRFGLHKTRSGKLLKCVPIREILQKSWPGDHTCGYKKKKSPISDLNFGL